MSRENLDLIRDMLEARDAAALRAVLHDDVEWDVGTLQILGTRGRYRGPDGVLEFFREWVGAFSDWDYEVVEIFARGDCVIAELRQWGTGKASGARVEQHWWQVWKLRDGKAIRGTNHDTRADALEAAAA